MTTRRRKQNVTKEDLNDEFIRFRLPEVIKERFKLWCYLKGTRMTDVVRDMIVEKMNEEDMESELANRLNAERLQKRERHKLNH